MAALDWSIISIAARHDRALFFPVCVSTQGRVFSASISDLGGKPCSSPVTKLAFDQSARF
ncbi:hypothetical protein [Methylosinus sp. R-45379]|uniref:hypothetical protein n=1 Tax=Methylosinus sp. R-45379 TaxID=980563 RepID=UPI000A65CD72|nr:hypothetical protein [Methylosinus sp. R-45379]